LAQGKKIFIAQGQKILEFLPTPENQTAVLQKAMGRSGNLRAPTMLIDDVYYVGFNVTLYESLFDSAG